MYLPYFHLLLGPFSPVNETTGCTMRQYGMKAMERGKNENLTTHMQHKHSRTHFIYLLCTTILHSSFILPSDSMRLGKPDMRRTKGSLSYLPSPSSILPFEVFHVNNRRLPNQSLPLVHWLEDKRAVLLPDSLWCMKCMILHVLWSWVKGCWLEKLEIHIGKSRRKIVKSNLVPGEDPLISINILS